MLTILSVSFRGLIDGIEDLPKNKTVQVRSRLGGWGGGMDGMESGSLTSEPAKLGLSL